MFFFLLPSQTLKFPLQLPEITQKKKKITKTLRIN